MEFLLAWILTLIISTILFYRVSGSLNIKKPNMISISYYYSFLLSSFIGPVLIAMNIDHYYMLGKLDHEIYREIGFWILCILMIAFPLVMLTVSKLVGFNAKKEFNDYFNAPIKPVFQERTEFYYLFAGLSVICIGAVVYTLYFTKEIPLVHLFMGSSNLAELRIEAARGFAGNVLIRNIFAIALTPLLSLVAYIYSYKTGAPRWRLLFVALFVCSIIIMTYTLAKSPIFFYTIMFILVNIYIGALKLSIKKILVIGSLGATLLVLMYIYIQGVNELSEFLSYSSGPIGRIIFAQISPFFLHLDYFGNSIPFLNGKSFPSTLLNLYDLEQVRSSRLVMKEAFPSNVEEGTAGVLNTLFLGEAYANFGYVGISFAILSIAIIVQSMYIIFIRLPKNPIFLSLFIYFTINIPRTIVGGFIDFFFNPIWIVVSVFLVGAILTIRFRLDITRYFIKQR